MKTEDSMLLKNLATVNESDLKVFDEWYNSDGRKMSVEKLKLHKELIELGFTYDEGDFEKDGLVIYKDADGTLLLTVGDYRNNVNMKIESIEDVKFILERIKK